MRIWNYLFSFALVIAGANICFSQETRDDTHLIQSFFYDAAKSEATYFNGGIGFASYNSFNQFGLGFSAHIPFSPHFEASAQITYLNLNRDGALAGGSGLDDLFLSGKYHLDIEQLQVSAGGFATFPLGSDDVGGGTVDFGFFGAARYPLLKSTVLTGMAGLFSIDSGPNRQNSLQLAPGVIYQLNETTHLIGELVIRTGNDFMLLSVGGDLEMSANGRVRGGLGLGLDSGAPDISLFVSYLLSF